MASNNDDLSEVVMVDQTFGFIGSANSQELEIADGANIIEVIDENVT